MNISRKYNGPSSQNTPFAVSKESKEWLIMMKYMLECAEKSLIILDSTKEQLDFDTNDLEKFSHLCDALEEARHQMALLGRKFFEGSAGNYSDDSLIIQPERLSISKKVASSQTVEKTSSIKSDDENLIQSVYNFQNEMKTKTTPKDACICKVFKERIIKRSTTREIKICSLITKPSLVNENCQQKNEAIKATESEEHPCPNLEASQGYEEIQGSGKTDKEEILDESNPFILKHPPTFSLPETGVGYEMFYAMKRHRDKLAQISEEDDDQKTFDTLLKMAISVAIKLKKKGLSENSQVTVCVKNDKNACLPVLGALFIGCRMNGLDIAFNKSDIKYFLDLAPPDILFIDREKLEIFMQIFQHTKETIPLVIMDGDPDEFESFQDYLLAADRDIMRFRPYKVDSMKRNCIFLFSSGTAGTPKTICLSHDAVLSQLLNVCASDNLRRIFVNYDSFYWISAIILLGYSCLAGVARVVPLPFDPERFYQLLDKYKVEATFLGPYECIVLGNTPKPDDLDVSSLRTLITGGAMIKETVILKLRNIFPKCVIFPIYGQTETAGVLTWWEVHSKDDQILINSKPTACGRPYAGFRYKIIDDKTGEIVGPNQQGELCVKSDTIMMNGYYNLDSSECYDKFGWLKTGDMAYYDEYNCFFVVDRLKELIKFREWHIAPMQLENILMAHPDVRRAVVIGIPHAIDIEHATGLIVLKEGVDEKAVNLDEITEFVNKRVADRLQLRGGVRIIHSVPLTVTGKVKRRALRDALLYGTPL